MRVMYLNTIHQSGIQKLFNLGYKILLRKLNLPQNGPQVWFALLFFTLRSLFYNKDYKKRSVIFLKKNEKILSQDFHRAVWVGNLKDDLAPALLLDTFHQSRLLYFIIKSMFSQYLYLYNILFVCMLMQKKNNTNSLSLDSYSLSWKCAVCSPSLGAATCLCSCNCKQSHRQCTLLF